MIATKNTRVTVVGGGLAGSECALQLAHSGIPVLLFEMRDKEMTPAHRTKKLAEIVCSNSFGSMSELSAPGQLKWEARKLNSFILKAAELAQVPAGQALGIDREFFSNTITEWIENHPLIEVRRELVDSIENLPRPCVIATGPLTHDALAASLQRHFGGDFLYFFDAIAPIVDAESIDDTIAWKADRYDKGSPDYYNCPLTKDEYFAFIQAIKDARKIEPKHFEQTPFFESCMPIETMVARGDQTLRFGPMKPVGLTNPKTGRYPFAVVQLRQENKEGTAYNIVGFQTRMAYPDQKQVFKMIPGLQNAEFLKLGSIHRNLYVNTPKLLNQDLSSKNDFDLYFAGQITGVEGYFESTCIGLLVARNLIAKINERPFNPPPRSSAFGSLLNAITDETKIKHFQPTNINMSLFPSLTEKYSDKSERKMAQIKKAQEALATWA
jgi:methylenetetrahydrofolate--tRNA-(uracil-5-)-methyltransferase